MCLSSEHRESTHRIQRIMIALSLLCLSVCFCARSSTRIPFDLSPPVMPAARWIARVRATSSQFKTPSVRPPSPNPLLVTQSVRVDQSNQSRTDPAPPHVCISAGWYFSFPPCDALNTAKANTTVCDDPRTTRGEKPQDHTVTETQRPKHNEHHLFGLSSSLLDIFSAFVASQ